MEKESNINLVPMKFPEDKNEISEWENKYKNTDGMKDIYHYIMKDNIYYGLDEVIETNHEIFPIGDDEKKLALVAKTDTNEIAGWVLLDVYDLNTNDSTMFVQYIVINPAFQHQGIGTKIGKQLFLSPEKYVGVKPGEIFAIIDKSNSASINLFSKFNFKFNGNDKKYYQAKAFQPKLIKNSEPGFGE